MINQEKKQKQQPTQAQQEDQENSSPSKNICLKHQFCNHGYQFSDQTRIIREYYQPFNLAFGEQCPVPQARDRRLNPLPEFNFKDLTQEALDDWIAQSNNRHIISFLDPYKQFHAPNSLISALQKRYRKWIKSKEKDDEKQRLYFDEKLPGNGKQRLYQSSSKPKNQFIDATFKYEKLTPQKFPGTAIQKREENSYLNITNDMNNFSMIQINNEKEISQAEFSVANASMMKNQTYRRPNPEAINGRVSVTAEKGQRDILNQRNQSMHITNNSFNKTVKDQGGSLGNSALFNTPKINQFRITDSGFQGNQRGNAQEPNTVSPFITKSYIANSSASPSPKKVGPQTTGSSPVGKMMALNSPNQNKQNNINIRNSEAYQQFRKQIVVRVDGLLGMENNQQIQITNTDIQNLNIHVNELTQNNDKKDQAQMNNVEFSFWRAVRRIKKGTYEAAISCLRQTLLLDKLHFNSIYNLICLYERTQCFELAKKWIEIGLEMGKRKDDINFCLALCLYKTFQFTECFALIEILEKEHEEEKEKREEDSDDEEQKDLEQQGQGEGQEDEEEQKEDEFKKTDQEFDFRGQQIGYLKALTCKHLGKMVDAGQAYGLFLQNTCPQNFMLLMHFMFSMVFQKLRGLEIQFDPLTFCDFHTLVKQILAAQEFQPVAERYQSNSIWKGNQEHQLVNVVPALREKSFFCRFTPEQLVQCLPDMNFKRAESNMMIFPEPNEIILIIAGHVVVYDHTKVFNVPDIIAYFNQGDVIGCDDKDNQTSMRPDIWFATQTPVEYVSIHREKFKEIWKLQLNQAKNQEKLNFLSKIFIFEGVSELGMFRFAYELMKDVVFYRGDIIFNDSQCIEKHHYIQLKKNNGQDVKNVVDRINKKISKFDYTKQKIKGFYIIRKGFCELETPTDWTEHTFGPGDFIGEVLLFNSVSMTRFGRILAKSETVQCLFLPREDFDQLNLLDREIMKKNVRNSNYFQNCQSLLYRYFQLYQEQEEM